MKVIRGFFKSRTGSRLSYALHVCRPHAPVIVSCHGFLSSKSSHARLAKSLSSKGFNFLRFDFYANGQSSGKFEDITISEYLFDLEGAIDFVSAHRAASTKRLSVFGSSLGGMVATLAASKDKRIKALILRAPLSDFSANWNDRFAGVLSEWKRRGSMDMELFRIKFRLKYNFYQDAIKYDVYDSAKSIAIPCMIVHGDADSIVPLSQSTKLVSRLSYGNLVVAKGATHRFSPEQESWMAEKVIGFLSGS